VYILRPSIPKRIEGYRWQSFAPPAAGQIPPLPWTNLSPPDTLTSNLPFDEWTEVFGSERLTGALLDRLTHHVHILEMNGDSYRLNQSKKTAKIPKNLTAETPVNPVGPQAPPALLRFA